MKSDYYYLTITHHFKEDGTPHAAYIEEFEAPNWDTALAKSLEILRAQDKKAAVIAASMWKFDGPPLDVSAHPSKRLLRSHTFQPSAWSRPVNVIAP